LHEGGGRGHFLHPVVCSFKILKSQTGSTRNFAFRPRFSTKVRFEPVRNSIGFVRTGSKMRVWYKDFHTIMVRTSSNRVRTGSKMRVWYKDFHIILVRTSPNRVRTNSNMCVWHKDFHTIVVRTSSNRVRTSSNMRVWHKDFHIIMVRSGSHQFDHVRLTQGSQHNYGSNQFEPRSNQFENARFCHKDFHLGSNQLSLTRRSSKVSGCSPANRERELGLDCKDGTYAASKNVSPGVRRTWTVFLMSHLDLPGSLAPPGSGVGCVWNEKPTCAMKLFIR